MLLQAMARRVLDGQVRVCDREPTKAVVLEVCERRLPVDHGVQDNAEGPDIRRTANLVGRIWAWFQDLWRHIGDGAEDVLSVDVRCCLASDAVGGAKVDELQAPTYEEEVRGLQVRVHDAARVHSVHALQHLAPQRLDVSQGQLWARMQVPTEVRPSELHHDVDCAPLRDELGVDHLDDMRTTLQLLQQFHLARPDLELARLRGPRTLQRNMSRGRWR
mmetsp:Transcript_26787/g.77388  ORF Transcript_26787/g.77388 Transcript_26787/m.77388 type:complete len:218 (+) Transcript_26787:666-1319(+)